METPETANQFALSIKLLHAEARTSYNHLRALSQIYDSIHMNKFINDQTIFAILNELKLIDTVNVLVLEPFCSEFEKLNVSEEIKHALRNYYEKNIRFSPKMELLLLRNSLAKHERMAIIKNDVKTELTNYIALNQGVPRNIKQFG